MNLRRQMNPLPVDLFDIRRGRTKRNRDQQGSGFNRRVEQFGTRLQRPGHQADAKALLVISTSQRRLAGNVLNRRLAANPYHAQAPRLRNSASQAATSSAGHWRANNRIA